MALCLKKTLSSPANHSLYKSAHSHLPYRSYDRYDKYWCTNCVVVWHVHIQSINNKLFGALVTFTHHFASMSEEEESVPFVRVSVYNLSNSPMPSTSNVSSINTIKCTSSTTLPNKNLLAPL